MLVGPPGTGKSVLAATLASRTAKRVVEFGAIAIREQRLSDGSLPKVALLSSAERLELARAWERLESAVAEDVVVVLDKPESFRTALGDAERLKALLVNASAPVVLCEQDSAEAAALAPPNSTLVTLYTTVDIETDLLSFVAEWSGCDGTFAGVQTSTVLRADAVRARLERRADGQSRSA